VRTALVIAVPEVDEQLRRGLPIAARATHVTQLEEFAPNRWSERRRYRLRGSGTRP
jgi:hypothetical protein